MPSCIESRGRGAPTCALQYGRPVGRRGRGRHAYRKTVPGCPGVGSSVRTVFFFFFGGERPFTVAMTPIPPSTRAMAAFLG
eukprot:665582-Prymnesium_polylepis.1